MNTTIKGITPSDFIRLCGVTKTSSVLYCYLDTNPKFIDGWLGSAKECSMLQEGKPFRVLYMSGTFKRVGERILRQNSIKDEWF